MAKFKFYVYDPANISDIGVELNIRVDAALTRNAEKDHIVNEQMLKNYEKVKSLYIDYFKKIGILLDPNDVSVKLDFISSNTKWITGDYYAHEYDEFINGKYRLLRMRSGRKFYEVECLDKEYDVVDGIWDYTERGRIDNGSGDYIE